jgi:nitric oxide reductase NorE protein
VVKSLNKPDASGPHLNSHQGGPHIEKSKDAQHVHSPSSDRIYPPGDLALWVFILAELLVFAVFFSAYAFARANNVELFNTFQPTLDTNSALVNTLALITSSYFVMRSVAAIRENKSQQCFQWLIAALLMGFVFLIVKSGEYAHHYEEGINIRTNLFYMFYLSLTFFHFMHVIMGMVILTAVAIKAKKGGYSAGEHTGVESGASYWHMVDIVWLVLFPLVYIMH